MHRLDAGVKGRNVCLEFARPVPLTPPAGLNGLNSAVAAPGDYPRGLGGPQIPPRNKRLGMQPLIYLFLIGPDLGLRGSSAHMFGDFTGRRGVEEWRSKGVGEWRSGG